MKPYYEQDGITIYHGDCLEVLPELGTFDLIFTSPPYNLGVSSGAGIRHYASTANMKARGGSGKWPGAALADGYADHDDAMIPAEYENWQRQVLTELWEHTSGAIFYNHKPRVQSLALWTPLVLNPGLPLRQIITWARAGGINFAPTHYLPTYEWILVFARKDWRLKSKGASGVGDLWRVNQESSTEHPAPFPIGLPARAIESTGPGSILDPFMGSGTTLRAALDAGIPAIGIELSEAYCEIAAKRLAQGAFDFGGAALDGEG